jgi:uncharacterized protein (TIGR02246 family)
MKSLYAIVLVLMAGPLAAAAGSPQQEIETSNAGWAAAFNAGDTGALSAFYAEDATVVAPSMEIVSDRAEIGKFWAAQYSAGIRDFQVETVNLRADGDRVYQTAVWSATVNLHGHHGHAVDGEITNVLERQADGSWKIQLQHWY